jgi:hypothetical protein
MLTIYSSNTIVDYCYPSVPAEMSDMIETIIDDTLAIPFLQECFSDFRNNWEMLPICVGFAVVVSLIFTFFIKYCSDCFVWSTVVLFWVLLAMVGTFCFLIGIVPEIQDVIDYRNLSPSFQDRNYQVWFAVVCWALALLELLIVCCFYKQIRICTTPLITAIGILKAAADFTRQQCVVIFIPIITTIIQILFLAVWLTTILYIISSSPTIKPINKTPFGFVQFDFNIQIYAILYVVGLLW